MNTLCIDPRFELDMQDSDCNSCPTIHLQEKKNLIDLNEVEHHLLSALCPLKLTK